MPYSERGYRAIEGRWSSVCNSVQSHHLSWEASFIFNDGWSVIEVIVIQNVGAFLKPVDPYVSVIIGYVCESNLNDNPAPPF